MKDLLAILLKPLLAVLVCLFWFAVAVLVARCDLDAAAVPFGG